MMNKDNRNDKIRKIAKKGLTFSLSPVLWLADTSSIQNDPDVIFFERTIEST